MKPTYSVQLWDHEVEPQGAWSGELAQKIVGENIGLDRQKLAQAFRILLSAGWSDVSVYVWLDNQLEQRQEAFREWCVGVRDPAEKASEGTRTLYAKNGRAFAEYRIAQLEDGFAISTRFEYVGFMGHGTPWMEKKDRDECVATFLEQGNRFFEKEPQDASELHKEARRDMMALLNPSGLFGFVEPLPFKD